VAKSNAHAAPPDAMFAWALRWQSEPDYPVGPLELADGHYTAVMARAPFIRAVHEQCPVAFGELLAELRALPPLPNLSKTTDTRDDTFAAKVRLCVLGPHGLASTNAASRGVLGSLRW